MKQVPRPEYPRPSWRREEWLNLNGEWDFAIDAKAQRNEQNVDFDQKILVPFCPEAKLSGIGNTDFMEVVWYRRKVTVPKKWQGRRLLLHFQAVDYDATVWIDGELKYTHRGCFTPFTVDLGTWGKGSFTIVLRAQTLRDRNRPRGKQSEQKDNHHCCYTRTSGIWQTVWLEPVGDVYMKRPRITPVAEGFYVETPLTANKAGWKVRASVKIGDDVVCTAEASAVSSFAPTLMLRIPKRKWHFWSPDEPFLYGLDFELLDDKGKVRDTAQSYGGLRFITIDGTCMMLNGKPMYQRLVLDQGYYPDGIWTAPSDEALVNDIMLSMEVGFNGARLHQKVFEERFLYHADRLGYLVWGEFGDWGTSWFMDKQPEASLYQPGVSMLGQWLEELERDYSHPSIVGWCGLNETHVRKLGEADNKWLLMDLTKAVFLAAKCTDKTRPVLDASGYVHFMLETDVFDTHDYGQPDEVAAHLASYEPPCICDTYCEKVHSQPWLGQPFFISEIGGIGWPVKKGDFSYGPTPKTTDEVLDRFTRLIAAIKADKRVFGYCYTQLTDVYQETNGLYYFDRKPKFDAAKLRAAQL
ncbi:MAG: hypothetical protein J5746_11875 [Victivallales bacterium]|nr:hypothetical protein [Victivallales bacterium]